MCMRCAERCRKWLPKLGYSLEDGVWLHASGDRIVDAEIDTAHGKIIFRALWEKIAALPQMASHVP